ncbi:MAG: hypothetical protein J5941_01055, partial [Solobacterium sp.]|nr:hypothetical protein [Solobacterium sp.]
MGVFLADCLQGVPKPGGHQTGIQNRDCRLPDSCRINAFKQHRADYSDNPCTKKLNAGEPDLIEVFDDMVKGRIAVDVSELDDMVIRRADGMPTYNMAVVVDDYEMGITHVIRGDDHVSNTPRQILIYEALGLPVPTFGHVPMILGPDKQKLSKRHGARAVIEYQHDGLLPQALVNYLVRLGWSHGNQELFSREELIEFFDGKNLNPASAA